ncbi:hypothetical protein [Clostridium sp. Marseille-P2415]|uniref:hypothetical protein n=1 Tax=Clostridium sp. Marseille-P2415 TaxID=1805471 RepID=UPI00098883F2|nr:hypothetical protein [Clostridium sp. Marseille-P2415]
MQLEYLVRDHVTKEILMKNGFEPRKDTFFYQSYLYRKIIKVKFTIDLTERCMHWYIYDCTNQKPYFAFYNSVNKNRNKVAMEVIEQFNNLIKKFTEAEIIVGD